MAATQRKRNGKAYQPAYHSRERVTVEDRCGRNEDTFWSFEPNGVRFADGHQTRPRVFAQWKAVAQEVPARRDAELFTDADFEALLDKPEATTSSDEVAADEERLNITRIDHPAKRTFKENSSSVRQATARRLAGQGARRPSPVPQAQLGRTYAL